jgi:hypothetical protein
MKLQRILAPMLLAALLLTACGDSGDVKPAPSPSDATTSDVVTQASAPVETPPAADPVADPYEVTYSKARTYTNSIGTVWIQTIIEVENTGSAPLYLSSGTVDIEKADGSLIESLSTVGVYPDVINPGEKAYYYDESTLDADPGADIVAVPHPDIEIAKVDTIRFPLSDITLRNGKYGGVEAIGRVENNSDEEQALLYIAIFLYDANNDPIGVMFTIPDNIAAGDTVSFEASSRAMPDDITAESVDHFDAFAYPMQLQF